MFHEKLEWDSQFFGLNIARASVDDEMVSKSDFDFSGTDLIYLFSKTKQMTLENEGVLLADEKVTYAKKINGNEINVYQNSVSYSSDVTDSLLSIGIASGWTSRFNLDTRLQPKFKELYKLWVINSINRTIADEVLLVKELNEFVGMVTLKKNNNIGKIGIIAVEEKSRGKNIGKKLLKDAEIWYTNNNISEAEVVTQKLNTGACHFYESNGYVVKSIEYVYHLWK